MALSFNSSNSLYDFVVRDGNGVKGLVDTGISEVPERYIQPLQERMMNKHDSRVCDVPPIDLSKLNGPEHEKVVDEIVRASETLGFFQVVNHGMSLELLESLKDTAHSFFSLPPEKKTVYRSGVSPMVKYGTSFVPEIEKAMEWKDFLSMTYSNDEDALKYWPNQCRDVSLEYMRLSSKMARDIVEILLSKLGVEAHESIIERIIGLKTVNMNYYPACPNPELTVGVGRHSDIGTITVLLQDGIGGLYVKLEDDNPQWLHIPPIPGALVINIGDTLQILSNGKYKSPEHRVKTTSSQSRVSVPVFLLPIPTEKIGPLAEVVKKDGLAHYKEVLVKDYMNNFFASVHLGKKSLDFARI